MKSPFTIKQQADHCWQLIKVLEALSDEQYQHDVIFDQNHGCALGWAAHHRIGALTLMDSGVICSPNLPSQSLIELVDQVFGTRSFKNIFVTNRILNEEELVLNEREVSIRRLRNQYTRLMDKSTLVSMVSVPLEEISTNIKLHQIEKQSEETEEVGGWL